MRQSVLTGAGGGGGAAAAAAAENQSQGFQMSILLLNI